MNRSSNVRGARDRWNIAMHLLANIMRDRFEYRRGNTLASLAEALLITWDANVKNHFSENLILDVLSGKAVMSRDSALRYGQVADFGKQVIAKVYAMPRLIPFWQYYFTFYKANKRLICLELLTK